MGFSRKLFGVKSAQHARTSANAEPPANNGDANAITQKSRFGQAPEGRAFYACTWLVLVFQASLIGAVARFFSNAIDSAVHRATVPDSLREGGPIESVTAQLHGVISDLPTWIPVGLLLLLFVYVMVGTPITSLLIAHELIPARMRPKKEPGNFFILAMFASLGIFGLFVYHEPPTR